MKFNAKTILRFLINHYKEVKKLFNYTKESKLITDGDLHSLKIDQLLTQFIDYSILIPIGDDQYRFKQQYSNFLAFLVEETALVLPEQLSKYHESLTQLFKRLKNTADHHHITTITRSLEKEIFDFLSDVEENTFALEREADKLRNTSRNQINYDKRTKQASYLIDKHVKPLVHILSQDRDEAIICIIRAIIDYTGKKRWYALNENEDENEAKPYASVEQPFRYAEAQLKEHSTRHINSTLPLLERIKESNAVNKGLKFLRDCYKKGAPEEKYKDAIPKLISKVNNRAIRDDYELLAKNVLQNFVEEAPVFIQEPEEVVFPWYFQEGFYQQKLLESLPIDDFFCWCVETLQQEEKEPVTLHKFFKIANLLFNSQCITDFKAEKKTLQLADTPIIVPILNLRKR